MDYKKDLKILLRQIDGNAKRLHNLIDDLDAGKDIDLDYAIIYCDIIQLRAKEILNHTREMKKEAND